MLLLKVSEHECGGLYRSNCSSVLVLFYVLCELQGEISSFHFMSAHMLSDLSNLIIGSSLNSIQDLDHNYGEVLGTNPDMFSKHLSGHSASN